MKTPANFFSDSKTIDNLKSLTGAGVVRVSVGPNEAGEEQFREGYTHSSPEPKEDEADEKERVATAFLGFEDGTGRSYQVPLKRLDAQPRPAPTKTGK